MRLGASQLSSLQWIVDIYALVFAGLLLPAGASGDRFGRKGALQLGLVIFGLGLARLVRRPTWQLSPSALPDGRRGGVHHARHPVDPDNVFPPDERPKAITMWAGFAGAGRVVGTGW